MALNSYDLAVIGGGPGVDVSAIRASQLGLKTVVIEKEAPGGVCLNWGCIPTKALLKNAELVLTMRHGEDYGIFCDNLRFDMSKAVQRSRKAANTLASCIKFLLKKNKIDIVSGEGCLDSANTIQVTNKTGEIQKIVSQAIIIATGSRSKRIPTVPVDGNQIITSTEAMLIEKPPETITIIGGGAIGVEFAYYFAAYGTKVTIVEMLPNLLPVEDLETSQMLEKSFSALDIQIKTNARVESAKSNSEGTSVIIEVNGQLETLKAELTLLAIGRDGNIEDVGLEKIGIETDRGFITVDEKCQTSVPDIYAIGDVTGPPLLAHKASAEGINLAERLAGHMSPGIDKTNIPSCTYCQPQVASLGLSEKEAVDQGYDVKIGVFPLSANGKALATEHRNGFVKIVSDSEIGDILGVHMIGHEVTELISHIAMTKLLEGTTQELGWLIHPHPTISETIKEAALATEKQAIHI